MIITSLVNTSLPHSYNVFLLIRTFKIFSLSSFQIYNRVYTLRIVILEFFLNEKCIYSLTQQFHIQDISYQCNSTYAQEHTLGCSLQSCP